MVAASNFIQHTSGRMPDINSDLLARAKNGDRQAFSEIVSLYGQMVYGFSFKVCRDKEKADETSQDTFINVYRKLKQFDGKSKFSTWLYSIVANNCLMKRRRSMLEESSVSIDELTSVHPRMDEATLSKNRVPAPSWKHTPLDEIMTRELRHVLDDAIQKLPVDYRMVFLLSDVEGQSAVETAQIMNISIPAVKSRLRRARVFLREQLNEYMSA